MTDNTHPRTDRELGLLITHRLQPVAVIKHTCLYLIMQRCTMCPIFSTPNVSHIWTLGMPKFSWHIDTINAPTNSKFHPSNQVHQLYYTNGIYPPMPVTQTSPPPSGICVTVDGRCPVGSLWSVELSVTVENDCCGSKLRFVVG